jgi:hypothetical protein
MHTDVGIPGLDSAGARHPVSLAGAREVPAGRRKQRSSEKRPPDCFLPCRLGKQATSDYQRRLQHVGASTSRR